MDMVLCRLSLGHPLEKTESDDPTANKEATHNLASRLSNGSRFSASQKKGCEFIVRRQFVSKVTSIDGQQNTEVPGARLA